MDRCCSNLQVRGTGSGKQYFETAMQQYQYSGTSWGRPRYTMKAEGKTCDLVYAKETYVNRFKNEFAPGIGGEAHDLLLPDTLPHRYKLDTPRNYWKVILLECFI